MKFNRISGKITYRFFLIINTLSLILLIIGINSEPTRNKSGKEIDIVQKNNSTKRKNLNYDKCFNSLHLMPHSFF